MKTQKFRVLENKVNLEKNKWSRNSQLFHSMIVRDVAVVHQHDAFAYKVHHLIISEFTR